MTREAVLLDVKADSNKRGRPVIYQGRPMSVPVAPPRLVKSAHVSGNQVDVFHCFAGETRYLTPAGVKTLEETAGTVQWVLTGDAYAHGGRWAEAMIHDFGEQPVLRVTLQRNKQTKVIRATPEHDWLLTAGPNRDRLRRVKTTELRKGHRLPHLRAPWALVEPDHEGIRMGFVFGDGSIQTADSGRTYGSVSLWGAKRDLTKYFDETVTGVVTGCVSDGGVPGLRYSSGMIGYHKNLPDLRAPIEYLRGWLMGYFAADGSVSKDQGQITLTSASLENLEYVRDVATLLGIGTYAPTTKMRSGFGQEPTAIHTLGFSALDLDPDFFLREDQRAAARGQHHERFGWVVVSVEDHGEIERVYCPRVPGTESFVLEDNIHTGQCPFCGSGDVVARSDMSIGCGFCNSAFTVTVSPQYPAFPMSVGGQPYPWPGRPDGGLDPAMMGDPNAAMAGDGNGFGGQLIPGGGGGADDPDGDGDGDDAPPWADGGDKGASSDDGDDSDDKEAEVGGKKKPPFGKKSSIAIGRHSQAVGPGRVAVGSGAVPSGVVVPLYRTVTGARLPEVEFMRHLAIATAHDPNAMAQRVKQERRG